MPVRRGPAHRRGGIRGIHSLATSPGGGTDQRGRPSIALTGTSSVAAAGPPPSAASPSRPQRLGPRPQKRTRLRTQRRVAAVIGRA